MNKRIDINGKGIKTIDTSNWDNNITLVNLANNEITCIKPLAKFTNLTHVNLVNNKVKIVEPLLQLKKLYNLNIKDNPIEDIEHVAKIKTLRFLNVSWSYELMKLIIDGKFNHLERMYISDIDKYEFMYLKKKSINFIIPTKIITRDDHKLISEVKGNEM